MMCVKVTFSFVNRKAIGLFQSRVQTGFTFVPLFTFKHPYQETACGH